MNGIKQAKPIPSNLRGAAINSLALLTTEASRFMIRFGKLGRRRLRISVCVVRVVAVEGQDYGECNSVMVSSNNFETDGKSGHCQPSSPCGGYGAKHEASRLMPSCDLQLGRDAQMLFITLEEIQKHCGGDRLSEKHELQTGGMSVFQASLRLRMTGTQYDLRSWQDL
jgi:hypothetical protein